MGEDMKTATLLLVVALAASLGACRHGALASSEPDLSEVTDKLDTLEGKLSEMDAKLDDVTAKLEKADTKLAGIDVSTTQVKNKIINGF
jgi:peptidoglycan hydrolase CwlO-like protein